jgi:hypothetical protein
MSRKIAMNEAIDQHGKDWGFGLSILALLAANAILTVVIYNVLWLTGAAQQDMAAHCNERGEVVAHALLLTWGVWLVVGLLVATFKAKTLSSALLRGVLLVTAGAWVYRGFF